MDLSTFNLEADSERGASLVLRHPQLGTPIEYQKGGETLTMKIHVLGPDSKKARQAQADLLKSARPDMSEEEANRRAARYAAALCTGWENIVWEGQTVDFNRELAAEMFFKQAWMRQQIERFHADRANFFDVSSLG